MFSFPRIVYKAWKTRNMKIKQAFWKELQPPGAEETSND